NFLYIFCHILTPHSPSAAPSRWFATRARAGLAGRLVPSRLCPTVCASLLVCRRSSPPVASLSAAAAVAWVATVAILLQRGNTGKILVSSRSHATPTRSHHATTTFQARRTRARPASTPRPLAPTLALTRRGTVPSG